MNAQHIAYVKPCECGGHEDARWLTITDRNGRGLKVSGDGFHWSALPWTPEQYAAADYAGELGESSNVCLTIDGFHAGLGGDTGWTKNIHPEYRIPAGEYRYEFRIEWL